MKTTVQKINNLTIGFQSQKGEQISILKNITVFDVYKGDKISSDIKEKEFIKSENLTKIKD